MIQSNLGTNNPTQALASVWTQLDLMFRTVVKSPLERLKATFDKGQLNQTSVSQHFDTLADLQSTINEAKQSGNSKDFNRIEVIRETVDRKLKCYRDKYWELQAKNQKESGSKQVKFRTIIKFQGERAETVALMGALNESGKKTIPSASVNLVSNEQRETDQAPGMTWSQRVETTGQQQTGQQTSNNRGNIQGQKGYNNIGGQNGQNGQGKGKKDKCANCGLVGHLAKKCYKLIKLDVGKIDARIKELEMCWNCGEVGHKKHQCPIKEKPRCDECSNRHLTVFHAKNVKRNEENAEKARLAGFSPPPTNRGVNPIRPDQTGGRTDTGGQQNPTSSEAASRDPL